MLRLLIDAWQRYRDGNPRVRALVVDESGFQLTNSRSHGVFWALSWEEVEEIVAFKVDALTVDHVCLAFRRTGESGFYATDEGAPGWDELNAAIS